MLTTGELRVSKNLTIRGPGGDGPTVNGNGMSRVFHIMPGVTATIDGLVITNGAVSNDIGVFPLSTGGGIYSDHANLPVSNCTISGSSAALGGAR